MTVVFQIFLWTILLVRVLTESGRIKKENNSPIPQSKNGFIMIKHREGMKPLTQLTHTWLKRTFCGRTVYKFPGLLAFRAHTLTEQEEKGGGRGGWWKSSVKRGRREK